MKGLSGRVALVTGGTGLLGSAIATRLAVEGATAVVASRELRKAEIWAKRAELANTGCYIPLQLDLSDGRSIKDALRSLREDPGAPTVLIANASLREGLDTPVTQITRESFTRLFEVDIAGHFLLVREMLEQLAAEQSASIVFLSSIYGRIGVDHSIYPDGMAPTPIQYAAVKAAAVGMTRWMAAFWGRKGVRVNAVIAGGVQSAQRQPEEFVRNYSQRTMLGRMASASEIASAVVFLASDEASYVTGECLVVDGGFTAW